MASSLTSGIIYDSIKPERRKAYGPLTNNGGDKMTKMTEFYIGDKVEVSPKFLGGEAWHPGKIVGFDPNQMVTMFPETRRPCFEVKISGPTAPPDNVWAQALSLRKA